MFDRILDFLPGLIASVVYEQATRPLLKVFIDHSPTKGQHVNREPKSPGLRVARFLPVILQASIYLRNSASTVAVPRLRYDT